MSATASENLVSSTVASSLTRRRGGAAAGLALEAFATDEVFFASQRGTEVAAIFYTVLESALLNGLDPRTFVEYAVKRQIIAREPTLPSSAAALRG